MPRPARDTAATRRKPSTFAATLRRAILPATALAIMAFFGAYALIGTNGVLALGDYRRQIAQGEREYQALDKQRAMLRNRVSLLDPRHANPDLVDELVRKELNVAHPDEVIVPLK